MALHGTIAVNDHTIGVWEATRQPCRGNADEPGVCHRDHLYDCVVRVRQQGGEEECHAFTLKHTYAEGALALASKVLARALQ